MTNAEVIGIIVIAVIALSGFVTIVVKVTRSVTEPIEHLDKTFSEQLNALNISINKLMIVIEQIQRSMDKSERDINELFDIVRKLNDRILRLETEHDSMRK